MADTSADALKDLLAELDGFRSSAASLTMEPIRVEDWLRAWGVRVVAALEVAGQRHAATSIRGALRVQTGAVTIALNAQRVDQVRAWLYQALKQLGQQPGPVRVPSRAIPQSTQDGVFLSYRRRGGWSMARHVYGALENAGFDVFMDYRSLGSGEFEPVILNQIAARPHFVLLLGPTSLNGVHDPADWVRREIEHALRLKRNVIPVLFDGFSFKSEEFLAAAKQCPSLVKVSKMNGVEIPKDLPEYLDAALERLCEFLRKKPVMSVSLTPPEDLARVQVIQEQVRSSIADDDSDTPGGISGGREDLREIQQPGLESTQVMDQTDARTVRPVPTVHAQVVSDQDRAIESLRSEVADLKSGSDERNNLRREIKAMLDWLFTTEYAIKRAATKIDPKSHPNGHPPTFLKMPLEDPPELRELSPRTFFEPLSELKKFVQATKSIVEANRIRSEAAQFPARKSAILSALKRVDAEKRIGLSFPED
jgi:hypothetical protein